MMQNTYFTDLFRTQDVERIQELNSLILALLKNLT